MEKIWFILIENKEYGPFTIEELILNKNFTSITPTRKWYDLTWRPAKEFPEIEAIFSDRSNETKEKPKLQSLAEEFALQDEIVLDWKKKPIDPFIFYLILVLFVLLLIYLIKWQ